MSDPRAPDAYPLTPIQRGMLFHSVSAPDSDGYVQQLSSPLLGDLRIEDFQSAWEELLARHGVLRTAFAWKGLPEPLQVLGPRVKLPLEVLDWRHVPAGDRSAALSDLEKAERKRGFDLSRAPLMRLKLIRLADDAHRLVWTWHHAILDAWSAPIVLDELFVLYAALCDGRAAGLEPPRPFKDFIAWQRAQSDAGAEEFWRTRLDGFEEPTPLDFGPAPQAGAGADAGYSLEFIDLPAAEVLVLRNAARAMGVTLSTVFLGAWALLLGRYADRRDVVFGTALAGRPPELDGVESMVGLFINTLPMRVAIPPEAPLGDWLRELQRHQTEMRRYEHTPLADVQTWSSVPRGMPLFESLLVFEDFASHRKVLSGGGLTMGAGCFVERASLPLSVTMTIGDVGRLGAGFEHARFGMTSILRMLGHLRTLLAEMARGGGRLLGDLDPLTPDERRLILEDWSRNPHPVPDDLRLARLTVPRLFEERVRKSRDHVAAVFYTPGGDVSLTYGELNGLANRLARRLRALGVGPEERVAIHMEAGLDRVIAVLAVLKAGGAYVPLDPAYPKALVHELVVDCGPRVVLTQSRLADTLSGCAAPQVIVVDDASADTASELADDLPDGAELRHAAYLIYTSGSTGRRKGVLVSHDSFRSGIEALIDAFRVRTSRRVLQLASFSFDASVSEIFTTLVMGARLYMAPRDALIPSAEMVRLLNRWRIDNAIFPVSVLARLPAGALPDLRTMMVGGEACPADLPARWAAGRSMINAYGPTETTICTCVAVLQPDGTKPLIGRPCGDARFYILDGGMNPVPVGAVGQLHIGGPVVTRGYWGRPALTAASFVPDPFSNVPGSRLYRTGDLARFLADGSIDCLGRIDGQLKIRGVRIEPGEIEAVLLEDPSVREAAVLAVGDTSESRRLVAFVVPEGGGEAMTGVPVELRERLRQRLPGYMVPAPIIPLDRLPLSTSGKIDRRALAIVAASEIAGGSGHRNATALNETETAVARIWQDLLKLDGIGLESNFFDLGGHSLMLLNVQERLQADTGVQIDVTDLFKYPTVSALADHLAKSRNRDRGASDPPPAAGRTRAAARQEALDRAARRRANPLAEVR